MDFHSFMRRDLQFLCKRNKIPANMTNLAMADALKSLEIVEGLDDYMTQSNAKAPHSPTSLAKQPPNTAARTTRRRTTMKAEPQSSSSQLVSRSTSKSLAGEMDQENVAQEPKTNIVAKTPAARSTRKALAAISCSSKVQESKKEGLVQSVYSTRRSTRLLEKCMGDLSLKTKDTLDGELVKNVETEEKVSAQEENPAGSEEAEVIIPSRDLSVSMEKEWEMLNNDSDKVDGDVEILVDLGDITVVDENTEINMEKVNEVMTNEKESEISLVQVDKQDETLQPENASMEKERKTLKIDSDQVDGNVEIYADPVVDVAVFDANTERTKEEMDDEKESENSLVQVDNKEEEILQPDEAMCEEGSEKNDNDQEIGDIEVYGALGDIPVLEHANTKSNNGKKESEYVLAFETSVQVNHQETEQVVIQENESEAEKINTFDEETIIDQTGGGSDSETEPEEDNSGADSDSTISEADSNVAVLGSDVADGEMMLSESEGSESSDAALPASPPLLLEEEGKLKTTPIAAESISVQFPRPSKTTPLKNSDNENKENNMEMMMMNVVESKVEAKKKKKVVEIDEESLKDVSMRQLVKMVKQLTIKTTSNRPALQILPGNNQIAE